MKHVIAVRGNYFDDLEKNVEKKLQELQSEGKEIVNVTMGGCGNESSQDWVDWSYIKKNNEISF